MNRHTVTLELTEYEFDVLSTVYTTWYKLIKKDPHTAEDSLALKILNHQIRLERARATKAEGSDK